MGFLKPDLPTDDPASVRKIPMQERMKMLSAHFAARGVGVPTAILSFYIIKMAVYIGLGILIVGLTTPDLGGFGNMANWWTEPIVYLKLMIFTILFEITGMSASSGPLTFKINPLIGGILYFGRVGTLRSAPWADKVPLTAGDTRTWWDVLLYWAILANLVVLLLHPGERHELLPDHFEAGLLPVWGLVSYLVMLAIMGLRDKAVFLASRAEQYPPVLFAFAVLTTFTDMIVAAKVVIVVVWVGAAISKLGRHFSPTVAAMMSNTAWVPSPVKKSLYRNYPEDLRPSKFTHFMAHVPGTILEFGLPLVLLFSTNRTVTLIALIGILAFHLFIVSTFPLAVPLEWNLFFMFTAVFLFWFYPAEAGYSVFDFSSVWVAALIFGMMLLPPIIGNIRPDLISFLVSYRQYAGNWASAVWAFRTREIEERLDKMGNPAKTYATQVRKFMGDDVGDVMLEKMLAWRAGHSMGRALFSLMYRHTHNVDEVYLRDGEVVCSSLMGWNFGEGHLHDERLIAAVQRRCNFEPGDIVVAFTESEPIHRNYTEYRVIDMALGVVERGWYYTKDATETQPWLPNGPIPHTVTWRLEGYVAPGERGVLQEAGETVENATQQEKVGE